MTKLNEYCAWIRVNFVCTVLELRRFKQALTGGNRNKYVVVSWSAYSSSINDRPKHYILAFSEYPNPLTSPIFLMTNFCRNFNHLHHSNTALVINFPLCPLKFTTSEHMLSSWIREHWCSVVIFFHHLKKTRTIYKNNITEYLLFHLSCLEHLVLILHPAHFH